MVLIMVYRLIKFAKYIPIIKKLNVFKFIKLMFRHIFKRYGLFEKIIFDKGLLFINRF